MASPLTTHVLDTSSGRPAAGIEVQLDTLDASGQWQALGAGTTDDDGRIGDLPAGASPLAPGTYRLTFHVEAYFSGRGTDSFLTAIPVVFRTKAPEDHIHVPLLLSPFGYATYKGS